MTRHLCPICRKDLAETTYRPFCGKRCADVDLQRWFVGAYAVPAEKAPDPSGETAEDD